MISPLLIQIIGFIGVAVFILSYQIKSNRMLFLFQLVGSALFCLQFYLLDARSGCLSLALNILRNAMLMRYNEWKWIQWKGWPIIISGLFTVVLFGTWNGPISLLAFTASVSSTMGYWSNNARRIRLVNLVCASPCWLIYDCLVSSWGGMLNESITLASIIVSIIRFGWKRLGQDTEFQK